MAKKRDRKLDKKEIDLFVDDKIISWKIPDNFTQTKKKNKNPKPSHFSFIYIHIDIIHIYTFIYILYMHIFMQNMSKITKY